MKRLWLQTGLTLMGMLALGLVMLTTPAVYSQDTAAQKIESDDTLVIRVGEWVGQNADGASGGSYLYNANPETGAALSLAFAGTSIEVVYVSGPGLGTLAIEVDGTVLRTVITTADKTSYGQVATIDYLSDESHTLKVYAQAGGVVGVDAFVVHSGPDNSSDDTTAAGFNGPRVPCSVNPLATERVSVVTGGNQATGGVSAAVAISNDGRYVAFHSQATNLVANDTNNATDVFVHDRQNCTTIRVSVSSGGVEGNFNSIQPDISADGRYVTFASIADNLVANDNNNQQDIFVRDLQTNTTSIVSVATDGTPSNNYSEQPVISANGRYVAFESFAGTLVAGDTNGALDIFVRDLQTNTTTRASVVTGGGQSNNLFAHAAAISGDGRYVAFYSRDCELAANDTNNFEDVFLHDNTLNTTIRVTNGIGGQSNGPSFQPVISADGRYVAFHSEAGNLVAGDTNNRTDIFVYAIQAATLTRVSVATGGAEVGGESLEPSISANGRYIAFQSTATTLSPPDTNASIDIFVHDTWNRSTARVSLGVNGAEANNHSYTPDVSGDGRWTAFESVATNLVASDSNVVSDTFVGLRNGVDTLALFRPDLNATSQIRSLLDLPIAEAYNSYTLTPPSNGQWVMGDWNGDFITTPAVYSNGAFFYTNDSGGPGSIWTGIWIGLVGRPPVAGRFNAAVHHDCLGAVDSANFPPYGMAFALYFTCDLTGGAPALTFQWLSVVLPDSSGATGTHQIAVGDFDGNGVDSIAFRRGTFIAWTNVPPITLLSEFSFAQFWGTPPVTGGDYGVFVAGDWTLDGADSFGVFYQNGNLYYRNDLFWNSQQFILQRVGQPIGTGVTAVTWRER